MTTTQNEKSPAPELASEAADSGAHATREGIVNTRVDLRSETSSKMTCTGALQVGVLRVPIHAARQRPSRRTS